MLACDPDAGGAIAWTLTPADVGEPLVGGEGFDPAEGALLGAAFPQLMPGWNDTFPAYDVPTAIWAIALHDLVAEEGVCPNEVLDGGGRIYQSNCRSKSGYEWTGDVTVDEWEEAGVEHARFDFSVQVDADVDEPRFDHLAIEGSVERSQSSTATHVDVNIQAELLGYFESRNELDDPRIATWGAWSASGSLELEGDDLRVDTHADIGGSGAFPLLAPGLATGEACPVEPAGDATMGDTVTAQFDGSSRCDACAMIVSKGGETEACAP